MLATHDRFRRRLIADRDFMPSTVGFVSRMIATGWISLVPFRVALIGRCDLKYYIFAKRRRDDLHADR